jgi:hypothetical protein
MLGAFTITEYYTPTRDRDEVEALIGRAALLKV